MTTKSSWLISAAAGALLLSGCYERETAGNTAGLSETDTDGGTPTGGDDTASSGGSSSESDAEGSTGGGTDPTGADTSADESGTGETTGGTGPGEETGGLDELIGTLCTWDFECCDDGEIDYRLGPFATDAADCTERYVEQLFSNDDIAETPRGDLLFVLGFGVRLDRSTPNATAVADCRTQLDDRACSQPPGDEAFCVAGNDAADNPCDIRNLFSGTQAVGDPCSGALASLGYDIECEAGSSCEEIDNIFLCVDKGLDGDFCEADHTCDQGLFCNISDGRCALKRGLDEACAFEDPLEPDFGTESIPCLEHLACDPFQERCVQYCSTGYDCAADQSCSEDESCIPVDIDENTYTYCQARGDTNGDRCDSDRDCADGLHCNGSACLSDLAQGTVCSLDGECQDGLYCDSAGTGNCEVVANANELCNSDAECNPSTTMGCMTSDNGRRCRTMLIDNGDPCAPGENAASPDANWCASGRCEDNTDDAVVNPECHDGAGLGDECDQSAATVDVFRCAHGSYCVEEECRAEQPAGGDCSDDAGLQCMNGSCAAVWQGDYCTDAAPLGDNTVTTCDGEN